MFRHARLLLLLILVFALLSSLSLAQGTTKQVGLVIRFSDGRVHSEVVTVPTAATVADVLRAASVSVTIADLAWGPALCAIDDMGCPADNCFCDPDMFWAFYLQQGGQWVPAPVGVGGYTPAHREVVGFAWSGFDASFNPTVQPPYLTFDQIATPPPNVIPEPATLLLVGGGLTALAGYVRRRRSG